MKEGYETPGETASAGGNTGSNPGGNKRERILEVLVREIEGNRASKITTRQLAAAVGVSESALYRHFPGKAAMFEALIESCEHSVFSTINRICADAGDDPERCCERIVRSVLHFVEGSTGISRVLLGEVLHGEDPRLSERVGNFFDRIETHISRVIQQAPSTPLSMRGRARVSANLIGAFLIGRIRQFNISGALPTETLDEQWALLARGVFGDLENNARRHRLEGGPGTNPRPGSSTSP
ncbi:nucleoid occlusion factor SlmA [Thioalkalivibrio sp. HK1]|uniref:nucleoid occlusion factor SlmA n=1 Tax=Thioalkalivibrio sp. HK1 TaxID=1469245 RepID=UPI0004BA065A|nr:nucleoid occlusion factor SlmA [Thioalkalivibrio sp. HK1]